MIRIFAPFALAVVVAPAVAAELPNAPPSPAPKSTACDVNGKKGFIFPLTGQCTTISGQIGVEVWGGVARARN